jgi:serine/threonine-protein kinase
MSAAPSVTPYASLAGAIVARRYRLLHLLGAGSVGLVFLAESVDGMSRVALKLLRPELVGDASVRARFLEEGRLASLVVHPNIARVLDFGTAEDGSPFLVMELLEGVPLSAYTEARTRMPAAQAQTLLYGVLSGLSAAHARGIVHRDLKPANIFLHRAPDGSTLVKLLDFGVAKVMDQAGGMGVRTKSGILLGTPAYMSPEQVVSAREVDARTDLFSAGVVFYELVTGRECFPARTEFERLSSIVHRPVEPVEHIDPALARFSSFLAHALAKDPNDRFPTADAMAHALAACGAHEALAPLASAEDEVTRAKAAGGGTLQSALAPVIPDPVPTEVTVVPPRTSEHGTLPSSGSLDFSRPNGTRKGRRERFAVPAMQAAGFVVAAFLLGIAFGFVLARGF